MKYIITFFIFVAVITVAYPQNPKTGTTTKVKTNKPASVAPQSTGIKVNPGVLADIDKLDQDNFESSLSLIMTYGPDQLRMTSGINAYLILTDGTQLKANIKGDNIPTKTVNNEVFVFKFPGKDNRVQYAEIIICERYRQLTETDDVCQIASLEMRVSTIDKKKNQIIGGKNLDQIFYKEYNSLQIVGSGVLRTDVLNAPKSFPKRLETDFPAAVRFCLLTGNDGAKDGFSEALFIVELKSGGIVETRLSNPGLGGFQKYESRTDNYVNWKDIKRIGVKYIYPSNAFSRDDWRIRGVSASFDSPYLGEIRIFANWNLEKTMNGDGQGTIWWSNVLSL